MSKSTYYSGKVTKNFLAFGIFSHLPHSLSLIPLHNMIITLCLSVLFCTAYLSCYLYFLVFHSHFLFFLKRISSHMYLRLSLLYLFCTLASTTFTFFFCWLHSHPAFIVRLSEGSESSANQYKSVYVAMLPPSLMVFFASCDLVTAVTAQVDLNNGGSTQLPKKINSHLQPQHTVYKLYSSEGYFGLCVV